MNFSTARTRRSTKASSYALARMLFADLFAAVKSILSYFERSSNNYPSIPAVRSRTNDLLVCITNCILEIGGLYNLTRARTPRQFEHGWTDSTAAVRRYGCLRHSSDLGHASFHHLALSHFSTNQTATYSDVRLTSQPNPAKKRFTANYHLEPCDANRSLTTSIRTRAPQVTSGFFSHLPSVA